MGIKSTDKSPKGVGENKRLDGYSIKYYSSSRSGGALEGDPPFSATGGTVSFATISGTPYQIHTFTSTASLDVAGPTGGKRADYFLVAGGGGSGPGSGGGGGAGGVIRLNGYPMGPGSYTVTVGAGGGVDSAGSDSSIVGNVPTGTLTAKGGGKGGYGPDTSDPLEPGKPGGSGGGVGFQDPNGHVRSGGTATQPSQPGLSGTFGSGFPGRPGKPGYTGGGGAGGQSPGPVGGVGISTDINGTTTFYAGGGGQTGGQGGGGGAGQSGGTNTGGGAGRGGPSGGPGIVIVRFNLNS